MGGGGGGRIGVRETDRGSLERCLYLEKRVMEGGRGGGQT